MARIQLKKTDVFFQDGLSGTAAVNNVAGYTAGASTMAIDTVALNVTNTAQHVATRVPVGARFTVAGETGTPIHTVSSKVDATDVTTSITFTPVLAGSVADDAVITFLPIRLTITVGEGNLTYTRTRGFIYDLDRGTIDAVREDDDVPLSVSLSVTFEAIKTGTNETTSPQEALDGEDGASEWRSSGADACEPYAIDIVALHNVTCGTKQNEEVTFPEFRYETFVPDYDAASIAVTGRCKTTKPTVARGV